MTDDARRARRRARNAHALAQCNGMGRTAGSVIWQPLVRKDGKYFMPEGAELSEPPVEFRSERMETILDEMDAVDAVAPTPVMQTLAQWKAEVEAALQNGPVDLTAGVLSDVGGVRKMVNGPIMPAAMHWFEPPAGYVRPEPPNPDFLVSLSELEKAIVEPTEFVADLPDRSMVTVDGDDVLIDWELVQTLAIRAPRGAFEEGFARILLAVCDGTWKDMPK